MALEQKRDTTRAEKLGCALNRIERGPDFVFLVLNLPNSVVRNNA